MLKIIISFLFLLQASYTHAFGEKSILKWKTKKGAQVIFYQAMEVPMVDISVAFAAGSAYDGENFGISYLTTELLNQGSNGLSATQIAEKLETTGAQYDASNNQDMIFLNLRSLTKPKFLQNATKTFALILAHPDFSNAAFLREKQQQLLALSQLQESPNEIANETFFQALYKNHPYAHPVLGNEPSVRKITRQQVEAFYKQYIVNKNAIIVLVGAIDKKIAASIAEMIVSELPIGEMPRPLPLAQPLKEDMFVQVEFPAKQTMVRMGQLGIKHLNQDYFPLLVGNYILGGGNLVSRLAIELRQQRGLTYAVSSQFSPMPGIGPFIVSFSTKKSQTKKAIAVTHSTLQKFIKHGPSELELESAKKYLMGSFPLSLESNRSISNTLVKMAFYGLPEDYLANYLSNINSVTTTEITQAFQRLLRPDQLLQVTVGNT